MPVKLWSQDFYQDKTVRIINYSKPGDSYDAWARLMARYMPRYIPGNPNMIVENLPGAGGLVAVNEVYNRAKPDGLTLLFPPRHFAVPQLVEIKTLNTMWPNSPTSEALIANLTSWASEPSIR